MAEQKYGTSATSKATAAPRSAIPNYEHIVHAVRDARAWDFSTKEGVCEYSNAVVVALNRADTNFGHLMKSEGQNHCVDPQGRNCSVDVTLWRPTGQTVDFVASAGPGSANAVVWMVNEDDNYSSDLWFAPVPGTEMPPMAPPGPSPEPGRDVALVKLDEILANQSRFTETQARDTAMIIARDDLNTQRILDRIEQVVENAEASGRKILALWLAQQGGTTPPPEGGTTPPDGAALLLLLLKALAERPAQE